MNVVRKRIMMKLYWLELKFNNDRWGEEWLEKITKIIKGWQFKQADQEEWHEATVPGFVHTDLLKHNMIEDPFYGKNEQDLQWIDKKDWEYQTTIHVDEALLNEDQVELVFHGLDTYATVSINGENILTTENMFRTYKVDVKNYLTAGDNTLRIYFKSPVEVDLPKLAALGYSLPAGNDHSEMGGLGDKRISIFARKAPYHYGWDWGPRFVTSGIWRDVELVAWSEVKITDFYINQKSITTETADLIAEVEAFSVSDWQGELEVMTGDFKWAETVSLKAGQNKITLDLSIDKPKLWWSRGLGDPHRYTFSAQLSKTNRVVSEKDVTTGLRSVKLVREPDQHGASFYIELNGVPVFAKGANHIPNDSFVTEVTEERYRHEIESAVAANMNMLRVWGGGIYEPNIFYSLCDEYGILVWQDFMFACSMYPGDEAFLENVKQEAIDNVKRLRHHPSVVLWCGNNEIDYAWANYNPRAGWGWKNDYDDETREKIWSDYQKLFHDILADVTGEYATNEPYWPSSPLVGVTDDIKQHASRVTGEGDAHFWEVWHGKKPFDEYGENVGRFMTEYGFQSFPELRTVEMFAEEKDYAIESEIMLHHQKNGGGNQRIKAYMDQYLPSPKDFPSFLYMSQVLQAEGVKEAIEAHRRDMPYCMGTLYWQMNDCWPVASWSSMDYYGRWKALHYIAKQSFKDEALMFEQTDDRLIVYAVSDKLETKEATVKLTLKDLTGTTINEESLTVDVKANQSTKLISLDLSTLIGDYKQEKLVMIGELIIDGLQVDEKKHYFVPTKDLPLETAELTVERLDEAGRFAISANNFSKSIWLDTAEHGYFSDNYFDLLPRERKIVSFIPRNGGKINSEMTVVAKSMSEMI